MDSEPIVNLEQPPSKTHEEQNLRFNIDTRQSVSIKAATNDIQVNTPQRLTLAQFQEFSQRKLALGPKRTIDPEKIIAPSSAPNISIRSHPMKTETSLTVEYDNKDINQKFGIILDGHHA